MTRSSLCLAGVTASAMSLFTIGVGCSSESKDTAAGDTAVDAACDIEIDSTYPEDGADDFYYRASIEFNLSDPDTSGPTITVDGVSGTTSYSDDNETIYFTPDAPLDPSTEYTATLSFCRGDSSITFSTSSLGEDISTDLLCKTYVVDFDSANFIEPATLGSMIGGLIPVDVLLSVMDVTDTTITIMGAISEEGSDPPVQDLTTPTIYFPEADFTDAPYFQVGPSTTTISVDVYSVPLYDLMISGTFAADGSSYGGGVLSAEIDARDIYMFLSDYGVADAQGLCDMSSDMLGVDCVSCSSDGEQLCLYLLADQIEANLNSNECLVEVTE